MTRIPASPTTETKILTDSARRCAFCYGFNGDLSRKRGQLAHIDHDPSRSTEDNLAFLCMPHHDEYDGKTSQSKNLTQQELQQYKAALIAAIARQDHVAAQNARTPDQRRDDDIREHDTQVFIASDGILPESHLRGILDRLSAAHEIRQSAFDQFSEYLYYFNDIGREYLTPELQEQETRYLDALDALQKFIALNFFDFPNKQASEDRRSCLHPRLNPDREGKGTKEEMVEYEQHVTQLKKRIRATGETYVSLRRAIKRTLLV